MNTELAIKYLLKVITTEEKKLFKDWLAESNTNLEQFKKFSQEWENSARVVKQFSPDEHKAWNKLNSVIIDTKTNRYSPARKIFITWRSAAASVAFLFLLSIIAYFVLSRNSVSGKYSIYSAGDTILQVTLADHSEVWLNDFSELRVPKNQNTDIHESYLKGEAFFQVATDNRRLFRVYTVHTTTDVHGTSFNLRSTELADIVNLVTGMISFYPNDHQENAIVLTLGDRAEFETSTGRVEKLTCDNTNFMAWKTGKLIFKDTPLPEVLTAIVNCYKLKLHDNQYLKTDYTLTANFEKQSIEDIISILELTWNVQVSIENNTLSIIYN